MPEYNIIRSKRKTLAIYIRSNGEVEVRAPRRVSLEVIEQAVQMREEWIRQKLEPIQQRVQLREDFTVTDSSKLTLLGREYPVEYAEKCAFDGVRFLIPREAFCVLRPQLFPLYKNIARGYLKDRVEEYSQKTALVPKSMRISSAATRWGSCSGTNALSFSWRLILAPPQAVDYVVVHELAHIREHNHSDRFWRLVEEILPDYEQSEKLLKVLQRKLAEENWDVKVQDPKIK